MPGKRLLIVEDDPKSLYALRVVLQDYGFDVTACKSVEEAQNLASGRFHAAIVDVRLPGLQGTDYARVLRQNGDKRKVILVTAYNGVREMRREFPECIILTKPLDITALLRLVE